MSNAYRPVDPLSGSRMGLGTFKPSAGLQKRLAEPTQPRKTAEGTFSTLPDGRQQFTPKLIEDTIKSDRRAAAQQVRAHNAKVLERMRSLAQIAEPGESHEVECQQSHVFADGEMVRITATVADLVDMFRVSPDDAVALLGLDGRVIDAFRGNYYVRFANGNKVSLLHLPPKFLRRAEPAEGDDEPVCSDDAFDLAYAATFAPLLPRAEAAKLMGMVQESCSALGMTQAELEQVMAAPSFDPLSEPLALGDYVEVVYLQPDGTADWRYGKRGTIVRFNGGNPMLAYDDGSKDECAGWLRRDSLKLLRKARG